MPNFETPDPITATIDVVSGDVRIRAGDRDTTVVDVRPSDTRDPEDVRAAEQTRVEYAGGHLLVRAPKLRSWLPRTDGGSVDITIELPAGSHVRGSGQLADFDCEGRLGDCRVTTGLGRIRLERAATLNLKSGTGDIAVEAVSGDAEVVTGTGEVRVGELARAGVIKNSNGDTFIGAARGDLRVNAANGRISVDVADASVVAKSANGDVRLGEAVRGSVVLESKLGSIEVGIRPGTAAYLDVSASFGRVHNALDAAAAPAGSDEKVEVRARTSVGDIVVRRP